MFASTYVVYWYLVLFAHGVGGTSITTVPQFFFTYEGCMSVGKSALVKMEKIVPRADFMCIAVDKQ